MAVLAMEQVRLVAMKRDRKHILDLLQRRGTVEVSDLTGQDEVFQKEDTSAIRLLLEKNIATTNAALELLGKFAPAKGGLAFLHGRTAVTVQQNKAFKKKRDELLRVAQRIVQLEREMAEARGEVARTEASIEALRPWLRLPVPQTFAGTKKTAAFIGSLEGEQPLDVLYAKLGQATPQLAPVHIEIVHQSKTQTAILAMVPKRLAEQAEDALRAIGFTRPAGASSKLPAQKRQQLQQRLEQAEACIQAAKEEIIGYADRREDLKFLEDDFKRRAEKHEVVERLAHTRHTFVLQGYVPAENASDLEKELTGTFDVAVELAPAERPGAEVPVKLKNNAIAEPAESVLEAYSMPGKTDIDPTNVMSIFYYIMFGLMFGDAGYGLIMAGICGFCLLRFKNMEPNWNKNIRMFFWCGVATIFWGVIFSSYFGDVVDVVSTTFFGRHVTIPPVWFIITEQPMLMLVFCLGIGVVHLTAGFIMKGVTNAKNGDYAGIIYDTAFPLLLWYPLVVLLAGSDMFYGLAGFRLALPPIVTPVCLAISGLAIVGIVFTGGRESKRWMIRLMKGAYAVYNTLSGWLSDTLSYARLLALGLASGVIGSVMNQLGSMAGGGVVGVIVFILVFAAGHAMNFGINVLGAYVHSNRLEYIEFFGKFYEGGGRKFAPFGIHTKYYKIVEEDQ